MSELFKKLGEVVAVNEVAKTMKVLIICGAVVAVASMGVSFNIGAGG